MPRAAVYSLVVVTFGVPLMSCDSGAPSSSSAPEKTGSVDSMEKKGALESTQFKPLSCEKNAQVVPSRDAQYVDVRRVLNGLSFSLLVQGKPCGGAEGESCMSQLRDLERAAAWRDVDAGSCADRRCPETVYALVTYGGRPARVETRDELKKLLGVIDTPTEAWLVAMMDSNVGAFSCDNEEFAAYRREGESFVVRERWYSKTCNPLELTESLYRVTPTGRVTKIGSRVVSSQPEACASN